MYHDLRWLGSHATVVGVDKYTFIVNRYQILHASCLGQECPIH